jgi:Ras-related GTP-binding protein C/D
MVGNAAVDAADAENVLILGLRRSGKSSIVEVVYKSLSPDDSLFLDSTLKCHPLLANTFQPVRIWDGASNIDKQGPAQRHEGQQTGAAASSSKKGGSDARGEAAWCTGGQLYWTECAAVIFVIDSQVGEKGVEVVLLVAS